MNKQKTASTYHRLTMQEKPPFLPNGINHSIIAEATEAPFMLCPPKAYKWPPEAVEKTQAR